MKKRLLALLLVTVLVCSVFVGCGQTMIEEAEANLDKYHKTPEKEYVTLNMYIPSKGTIDAEVVTAMQNEFNDELDPAFRTKVIFHLIDEATYENAVKTRASEALALKKAGTIEDTKPAAFDDNFPKEAEHQFDIFVATSDTMLDDMIGLGYVLDETTALTTTYNIKLSDPNKRELIPSVIYDNSFVTDTDGNQHRYGVPANFRIGQFSYFTIDKEWADTYYFDASETSAKTTQKRIDEVSSKPGFTEHSSTVTASYGEFEKLKADTTKYTLILNTPKLLRSMIFNGMFCIADTCDRTAGTTVRSERALELITMLYTNKALHSTLQYGAKNVTYKLAKTEANVTYVTLIPEAAGKYEIDTRYTGNIMMLYPCPEMGLPVGYTAELFDHNSFATYN